MYQLKINAEQARVISQALDFYSRILCGQLDELDIILRRRDRGTADGAPYPSNHIRGLLTVIKGLAFPELHPCSHYAVNENPVASTAYDLQQVIRHRLAWDTNKGQRGWTVDFDQPRKFGVLPLAEIRQCLPLEDQAQSPGE